MSLLRGANTVLRLPSCNSQHLLWRCSPCPATRPLGWLLDPSLPAPLGQPAAAAFIQLRQTWQGGEGTWAEECSPYCSCCQADSSSQSWAFPRFLHLPISAGGEVPAWPLAAAQLSRGGEVEGAAWAQLELLCPRH